MEPAQQNTALYHSWLQESFGLRSTVQPIRTPCGNNGALNCTDSAGCARDSHVHVSPSLELNHHSRGTAVQQISVEKTSDVAGSVARATPSINDLAQFDKAFDTQHSVNSKYPTSAKLDDGCSFNNCNQAVNLTNVHSGSLQDAECSIHSSTESDGHRRHSRSQGRDIKSKTVNFLRVQPTVYTASKWDSKVLFQYDMEEEAEDEQTGVSDVYHSLMSLPFELLRQIGMLAHKAASLAFFNSVTYALFFCITKNLLELTLCNY